LKRRLLLVNLVLLALIGAAGWKMRQNWIQARQREARMFGRPLQPAPAPSLPASPPVAPVTAGTYLDVAQQVLFSQDRNPVVVVEAAPPKPMPPLPIFYGVMDLGQGPTVILGEKPDGGHRGYKIGDRIGEFKLVSINRTEIEFEWDGQPVRRTLDQMAAVRRQLLAQQPQTQQQAPAAQPSPPQEQPAPPKPNSGSAVIATNVKPGPAPGKDGEIRGCVPGDNSPAGTVVDGYRKLISTTPFGKICRWEPVQ
jgi:hypothetical protein